MKKGGGGGITCILIPLPLKGEEVQYGKVADGPSVERIILDRNVEHFSQASDTPLCTDDVIDKLGFGGNHPIAQQILDGTADINAITPYEASCLFLGALTRDTKAIHVDITEDDMMQRYKRWKERTSTSPSGRHLGHYHALFRGFQYSTQEEFDSIDLMCKSIIHLHWLMLQIATKNQHVYQRWKKVVTQMIEKDIRSPKLHRLRVIHLYKCDFNLTLGIYFRQLQQHCEDNNLLNDGCYGGRPNQRAIDPVLVDVTQTKLAMIMQRALIRFNMDTTQCFDRILAHLANLNIQTYRIMPK